MNNLVNIVVKYCFTMFINTGKVVERRRVVNSSIIIMTKVILTVRDEDAWYKSIKKMNDAMVGSSFWMTYLSNSAYKYDYFMRTLYQSMLVGLVQ